MEEIVIRVETTNACDKFASSERFWKEHKMY